MPYRHGRSLVRKWLRSSPANSCRHPDVTAAVSGVTVVLTNEADRHGVELPIGISATGSGITTSAGSLAGGANGAVTALTVGVAGDRQESWI